MKIYLFSISILMASVVLSCADEAESADKPAILSPSITLKENEAALSIGNTALRSLKNFGRPTAKILDSKKEGELLYVVYRLGGLVLLDIFDNDHPKWKQPLVVSKVADSISTAVFENDAGDDVRLELKKGPKIVASIMCDRAYLLFGEYSNERPIAIVEDDGSFKAGLKPGKIQLDDGE